MSVCIGRHLLGRSCTIIENVNKVSAHLESRNEELLLFSGEATTVVVVVLAAICRRGSLSSRSLVCCTCCRSSCSCCWSSCSWDWTGGWDCCATRRTPDNCDRSSAIGSMLSLVFDEEDEGGRALLVAELPKLPARERGGLGLPTPPLG